jgi:preprotein translocase subunit Sec63
MGWLIKIGLAVLVGVMIYAWLMRRIGAARAMPAAEARALLGVGDGATLQEIRDAHRRLITRVHPDTGGSAELATRVNAARDALVAELNRRTPRAS